MSGGGRQILHVDMDAFFVSVELLDRPELRGKPVAVGGTGPRGVVASASYEARARGVRSAMPTVVARRLCPALEILQGRHGRYAEVSADVMALFATFTPLVEPLSLDEAFLDVTGSRRAFGEPRRIAARIRERCHEELGLRCSVGVAPNKFLAKLASEKAKPTPTLGGPAEGEGVMVVPPGGELGFLHPLPVESLWGVGPATLTRLGRLGISTVGQLAAVPLSTLTTSLGSGAGGHLHDLAHGRDDRQVVTDVEARSVSNEETFPVDLTDRGRLGVEVVRLADSVATRLRAGDRAARTVTLKVRFADLRTVTRSVTLDEPTAETRTLTDTARRLLEAIDVGPGIRLLGVGASRLVDAGTRQLTFDGLAGPDGPDGRRSRGPAEARDEAVDAIRRRFGPRAIIAASLVEGGSS